MKRLLLILIGLGVLALFFFTGKTGSGELTIYSGRSQALVSPVIERFEQETGISVQVKYGGTTQLAVALMEEGRRTPADIFWAQDAGALGAVKAAGLLQTLPESLLEDVSDMYKSSTGEWIATSGRSRVLVWNPQRVNADDLPESVFDLGDKKWSGRIAWAPANGSFQSFVSAMIYIHGIETTREWLISIRDNAAKNYANNNAILQGVAAGEADLGLTNQYYLYRSRAGDPRFPLENHFFRNGDVGNMINVAGVAVTASSANKDLAVQFIEFLLSDEIQQWFANETFEYPISDRKRSADERLVETLEELTEVSPQLNLEALSNLEDTLRLLREVGLL
jgi:iron(III) transport system substrate-binding protein